VKTPKEVEPPAGGVDAKASGDSGDAAEDGSPDADAPTAQHVATAKATAEMGTAIATVDIKRMVEVWPAVVDHVRQSGSEMLSTLFEGARPIAVDSERSIVRVGFPSSAKFNKRKAEAQANVERITDSVKAIVGERLRPVYELVEGEDEPTEPAAGEKELAEEEIIDLIKTKFDASEVLPDEDREEGTG
jgi:hypothetical protein